MKLTTNFSLEELIFSKTAIRNEIDNTPSEEEVYNLTLLADNVLQPVRDHFGPVIVTSGFRCRELEFCLYTKKIVKLYKDGGDAAVENWFKRKQHPKGEAADIEAPGVHNKELFEWIRNNLEFDQLVLEFHNPVIPDSGWVHVSYKEIGNRNKVDFIG